MSNWTVFLYTGHGLNNFLANTPDNIIVFVEGEYQEAKKSFTDRVGKEPELMGYQYVEGSSKEIAWQKAVDSDMGLGDVEFEAVMSLPDVLVIQNLNRE